jgi:hypothetical protein
MLTFAFIIIFSLYYFVAIKVDYWITIMLLGFPLECPEGFLRNESTYHWAVRFLFIASAILSYFSAISVYFIIPLFLAAWQSSGSIGHSKAYSKYRTGLIDLAQYEEDPTKKSEYIALSQKTNQQLTQDVLERA